jgi:hypothetical protein
MVGQQPQQAGVPAAAAGAHRNALPGSVVILIHGRQTGWFPVRSSFVWKIGNASR